MIWFEQSLVRFVLFWSIAVRDCWAIIIVWAVSLTFDKWSVCCIVDCRPAKYNRLHSLIYQTSFELFLQRLNHGFQSSFPHSWKFRLSFAAVDGWTLNKLVKTLSCCCFTSNVLFYSKTWTNCVYKRTYCSFSYRFIGGVCFFGRTFFIAQNINRDHIIFPFTFRGIWLWFRCFLKCWKYLQYHL